MNNSNMTDILSDSFVDAVRATTDHTTLRRWLQEVKAAIKKIVGDDPLGYYLHPLQESDIEKIQDLLGTRSYYLCIK